MKSPLKTKIIVLTGVEMNREIMIIKGAKKE